MGEGMCSLAIGTDTGGSCRIPAAFNGIVGYKSSVGRVPKTGVYPLSAEALPAGEIVDVMEVEFGLVQPATSRYLRRLREGSER